MATALIFARAARSRRPERPQTVGFFALPDKQDGPALQVQDQGQEAVAAAHADFVDGDLANALQGGLGVVLLQVPLLDVLDDVPAHPQMVGHVLDRHVPRELQHIAGEGAGVGPSLLGQSQANLPHDLAGPAFDARQRDDRGARRGDLAGGGFTEARGATGDDCRCSVEFQHGSDSIDRPVKWANRGA